jgi:nicotinate (nicotinamide) nucleotide adenylyltransferase
MLELALAASEKITVSDLELRREGKSYTYETVEQLHRMYPEDDLILLMGTDMFLTFHQWRYPERILKHARLGVFYRGTKGEKDDIEKRKQEMEQQGHTVHLLGNQVVDISSTQLRRMLAFECAAPFLPQGVGDYILDHGLYGVGRSLRNLPMDQLEPVVVSLLKPNRVKHVLGCRDTAAALAERWGADVTDAARASMLHDITKALDGPLQLTLCQEYGTILDDFGKRYPDSYDEILSELVRLSESQNMNDDVFEAEVTPVVTEVKKEDRKQEKQEVKTETAPRKTAQKYMEEISRLNDDIPDENISNGLYETCALLKQIQTLEERFPNSRNKLDKLYEYYLPILIRILKQYDNLQAAQTDPSYEETKAKLNRTLTLINDAMKTIISSMTDADFINLSADISTLEAVLQKDGLTKDSQIMPRTYGGQGED